MFLQNLSLPPKEHERERHHNEYLEEDPDIDTSEYAIEGDNVRVGKPETHRLIRDSSGKKE